MATFTPPFQDTYSAVDDLSYRATSPTGEDLTRMGRRLFRHAPSAPRARNVYLLTNDSVVTTLPPPLYDDDGTVTAAGPERVRRTFYGARGPYVVNAEEQALLEAAGYTVET